MKTRLLCGAAGLSVLVLSVAWPQALRDLEITTVSAFGGYLSFLGIVLSVYFLFYAMTGEWLPKLSKRKRQL